MECRSRLSDWEVNNDAPLIWRIHHSRQTALHMFRVNWIVEVKQRIKYLILHAILVQFERDSSIERRATNPGLCGVQNPCGTCTRWLLLAAHTVYIWVYLNSSCNNCTILYMVLNEIQLKWINSFAKGNRMRYSVRTPFWQYVLSTITTLLRIDQEMSWWEKPNWYR